VRTRLLPNESANHTFEYVYEFFEKPLSRADAAEKSAETRQKAISACQRGTVEKSAKTRKKTSFEVKIQDTENPYLDTPVSDSLSLEKRGQYNTNKKTTSNKTLSNQESIIPSAAGSKVFNTPSADNEEERAMKGYLQKVETYTDIVKSNVSYGCLGSWLCNEHSDGYEVADEIIGYMVTEICSPARYGRIRGQLVPRETIKAAMLKADIYAVENALLQMAKVDGVKSFPAYFISTLFSEVNQLHFRRNCDTRWANYAVQRDFG